MGIGLFNRRALPIAAAVIVGAVLAGEISFRMIAGERLLYRTDPAIEYMPQPGQSVSHRGTSIQTNEWGMRSPAVSREKPDGVFRVLVLGDSVVFGHTNINQGDLATTHLSALKRGDGQAIEPLNISAPSWGPGNLLAWIEANGLLDADAAIIVLSSHDLDDDRSFAAPDQNTYPRAQPLFALGAWAMRKLGLPRAKPTDPDPRSRGDARRSLPPLFARLSEAPSGGCFIIHSTTDELFSLTPSERLNELRGLAAAADLDIVHGRDFVSAADYVDDVHLSPEGQANLAKAMMACPAVAGGPLRG